MYGVSSNDEHHVHGILLPANSLQGEVPYSFRLHEINTYTPTTYLGLAYDNNRAAT